MFQIILIVQSRSYRSLYGNDPLASYHSQLDAKQIQPVIGVKRARPIVETIFAVPEYNQNYYQNIDNWSVKKHAELITKPIQLTANTFQSQFHEMQYRNVRNNYLKHRGYGYY